MQLETITDNSCLLIRRMRLAPGEAMYWHTDLCDRFTVIVAGSKLAIEYQNRQQVTELEVHPGMTGWDKPEPCCHRAINRSDEVYEEVVTFYRDSEGQEPQPRPE